MKIFLISFLAFAVLITACNKDKFQTIPSLSIKSYNTKEVPLNANFIVTLECTDKEGDVQDSVIIIKLRLNRRVVPTIQDTIRFKFPAFPKSDRIQIQVNLNNQLIRSAINPPTIPGSNPPQKESDTLLLKFAVRDNAGHTSDTVVSDQIIVLRQ